MLHKTLTCAAHLGLLLLALVLLAACGKKSPEPAAQGPQVVTSTPAPLVTRIVTPLPTPSPLPTATLAYDVMSVAGRWILRFDIQINGGTYAEQIRYSGAATFDVDVDGSLHGTGSFEPNISGGACEALVTDDTPLDFIVQGQTRPQDDQVWAAIQIVPGNARQKEHFLVTCPDQYNDARPLEEPVLWPILTSLQRLEWDFALANGQQQHFEADVAQVTKGKRDGLLVGDVWLSRQ